jgi:hypothetical protein
VISHDFLLFLFGLFRSRICCVQSYVQQSRYTSSHLWGKIRASLIQTEYIWTLNPSVLLPIDSGWIIQTNMHIWTEIQSLSLDYVFYNISIAVQVAQTLSGFTMCISLVVFFPPYSLFWGLFMFSEWHEGGSSLCSNMLDCQGMLYLRV